MSLMSVVEFSLWAVLGYLFWTGKQQRRFPAMGAYLVLRLASAPVLLLLLHGQAQHWLNDYCYVAYFVAYWSVYIVSAVLLYFVCIEVFRSALSAFSGLMKLGTVVFHWAAVVSVIVSFSAISFTHRGFLIVPDIALGLMRSVSIVELCLLAFLCLSMNTLRLSVRDMAFGIALGFGLMSTNDFVVVSLISYSTSLTAPLQFVYQSVILLVLGIWVAYCALPEPVRKPVVMPANSAIYRWNEIASALGHPGTQVAVQSASGFFLTDVENVVERAIARNLKSRKAES
jgi:hypothetical protein